MNGVVLIRLAAPMQSWGTRSRFGHRDTEMEPSKSGVIGLIAAAMGLARDADLSHLAAMRMGVRVDQAGHLETDYQTAMGVIKASGGRNDNAVLSWRSYLADARFLVGLEGPVSLCEEIRQALRSPRWPLFLGRKGYVPGEPLATMAVVRGSLVDALTTLDWPALSDGTPVARLPLVIDASSEELGDETWDVPISFEIGARRYGVRRIRRTFLSPASPSPDQEQNP